jgi:hypothetical protein
MNIDVQLGAILIFLGFVVGWLFDLSRRVSAIEERGQKTVTVIVNRTPDQDEKASF